MITVENLKKAVSELKGSETFTTIKFSERADKIDSYSNNEIVLKYEEFNLLAELQNLKLLLHNTVPYRKLRYLACNRCMFSIKQAFKEELVKSLSRTNSLIRSLLSNDSRSVRSAPTAKNSPDGCKLKCFIM